MAAISTTVSPYLAEERKSATFPMEELINLIDGGPEATAERRLYEKALLKIPIFGNMKKFLLINPEDYFARGLEMAVELKKYSETDPIIQTIFENHKLYIYPQLQRIVASVQSPLLLHSAMFTSIIESQGSEEQKQKWLPLAEKFQIIGTYCQTELGHGTNMRGLETTATYDPKTEEFIINSPTLTSTKFWPGGLSFTCNFAIVICQLYTQGVCRGIHLFLIQIRNLKDHKPFPGLTIGSVGPKMGMLGMDNGFLHFNNFRIPRESLLMKYAQVLPDGTYVKPPRERTGYGVFFHSRLYIAANAGFQIAHGATIAIRYGSVRHQGQIIPGEPEVKIMNYSTYQNKLFPHLAVAYAIIIGSKKFPYLLMNAVSSGTEDSIAELHALSSGLKALSTQAAVDGLEQCRLACGGLGYLIASRIPIILGTAIASCTYEGDNTVMLLQTARYLVKRYRLSKEGHEFPSSMSFMNQKDTPLSKGIYQKEFLTFFQKTTARLLTEISEKMIVQIQEGQIQEVVWQENANDLVKCAKLYCQCFFLEAFEKFCIEQEISDSLKKVFYHLYELLSIHWINENTSIIVQFSEADSEFLRALAIRWEKLLGLLRPNVVALVDGFDFCDEGILSILGCYDGNVYERVFDYVKSLPTAGKVHPAVKAYLNPLLVSKI